MFPFGIVITMETPDVSEFKYWSDQPEVKHYTKKHYFLPWP